MGKARGSQGQTRGKKRPQYIWDLRPSSPDERERRVPLKRSLVSIAAFLLLSGTSFAAERYQVEDEGSFGSTGRFVEFASRYGWDSYEAKFNFGLDMDARKLTRNSTLKIKIRRRDGKTWSYKCRARDDVMMWANIIRLYGKGVSILVECRIKPKKFAKIVDLDWTVVGGPTLVFQVMVEDGKARPGLQKGFYFLKSGDIHNGSMLEYAASSNDPSQLAVLFTSASGRSDLADYRILSRTYP